MENELDHSILQGRRDRVEEEFELLLTVGWLLGVLEVSDDIFLEVAGDAHVLHRSVCQIYWFLKFCVLNVQVLNDQGHVSEDVGVDDSSKRDSSHAKEDFPVSYGSDIIASQQQDGIIDADHVFVENIWAK